MKKLLLFLFCIPFLGITQNSYTINTAGMTFTPDTVTINLGDTVEFGPLGYHNAVEVDESTWTANDTAYNGGFYFALGSPGGYFIADSAKTYYYVCQPHASMEMKGVIIANAIQVPGCTDSLACNYDPTATIDDGSCVFTDGCTDSLACNYNSLATCDDGSCLTAYGCTDSTATNYNPLATCDDGCLYPLPPHANLFFSEYAEGSSNNKYFEIYNPTSDTIDLTNYAFARVNNTPNNGIGVYEYWVDFDSAAIILPNDVYVVVHPSADSLILLEADMEYGSLSNGDDGFALVYGTEPINPIGPDVAVNINISGFNSGQYHNGSYYFLSNSIASWIQADSICNAMGGHLATITDSLENIFIANMSFPNNPHIGLYQDTNSIDYSEYYLDAWTTPWAGWKWVTGETINFTNWYSNEPSNGGFGATEENYCQLYANTQSSSFATWNDVRIYNSPGGTVLEENFVLEIPSNLTANNGYIILDWIGDWNGDPGSGWDVAGENNATANHTLIRKCDVTQGDTSWTNAAGTNSANSQWIVLANDDWSDIGQHIILPCNLIYGCMDSLACNYDSIVVIDDGSCVYPGQIYQYNISICNGDSALIGNVYYSQAGLFIDSLINTIGCDSIVHTNLTIYSQFNSIFGGIPNNIVAGGGFYSGQQSLELSCYMPSELVSAVIYSQDTTLTTFEILDDNGNVLSDTTVNVIPGGHRIHFNYNMSAGSDYELGVNGGSNNLFRNNSGVSYPYNFGALASVTSSSAGGQYYYFFYDIEVKQSFQPTNYSICDGESITVAGNVYNTTGLYTDSLTSSIGCDSLVFTNLVVHLNTAYTNNQTICSGETYLTGGNIYDSTGIYIDSLNTQYGCDSVINTNLTVLTITGSIIPNNQTICFGDSISVGNSTYYNDGVYDDTLQDGNGCDSIIITTLVTSSAAYGSLYGGIPDTVSGPGAFSSYNGQLNLGNTLPSILKSATVYAQDTNSVTFELRDSSGIVLQNITHTVYPGEQVLNFNFLIPVDSNLHLGISAGGSGLYRSSIADGGNWSFPFNIGPVTINNANTGSTDYYYFYYDLKIMPLATYNAYSICEGDSIVVGASIYDTTGNYTDYFVASNSCDSMVYTVLEVYPTPSLTIGSMPNPPEICLGDSLVIEVTQGFINYWWNTGNPTDQNEDRVVVFPTQDFTYVVEALDSNGCEVRAEIFVDVDSCILGVDKLSFEEGLQVYPNPASEQLTIDFTGNATSVKVYNMLGELMIEKYIKEGQSSVQLFVKDWKGAMYSIQLYRQNGTITHKVFTVVR